MNGGEEEKSRKIGGDIATKGGGSVETLKGGDDSEGQAKNRGAKMKRRSADFVGVSYPPPPTPL